MDLGSNKCKLCFLRRRTAVQMPYSAKSIADVEVCRKSFEVSPIRNVDQVHTTRCVESMSSVFCPAHSGAKPIENSWQPANTLGGGLSLVAGSDRPHTHGTVLIAILVAVSTFEEGEQNRTDPLATRFQAERGCK